MIIDGSPDEMKVSVSGVSYRGVRVTSREQFVAYYAKGDKIIAVARYASASLAKCLSDGRTSACSETRLSSRPPSCSGLDSCHLRRRSRLERCAKFVAGYGVRLLIWCDATQDLLSIDVSTVSAKPKVA